MLLTAKHLLTMEETDYSPGTICIRQNLIHDIGNPDEIRKKYPQEKELILPNEIILPGFINTHCHLELSSLGPIRPKPPTSQKTSSDFFVSWIQELMRQKEKLTEQEIERGVQLRAKELLESGVTTIGDHFSFNTPLEILLKTPFRGVLFGEVIGINPGISKDIYESLKQIRDYYLQKNPLFHIRLTPHSVHALHPATLNEVIATEASPLSVHLAESYAEAQYFENSSGALADYIRHLGFEPSHQGLSGLDYLAKQDLSLGKLLIIHGNYLLPTDLDLIVAHKIMMTYCPRSHAFFGHQSFKLEEYLHKGIQIAIGTDSMASNTDLNFLNELKLLHKQYPQIATKQILKMATLNGAMALKMDHETGSIKKGKKADLIGFTLESGLITYESVIKKEKTCFVMIDGHIVHADALLQHSTNGPH